MAMLCFIARFYRLAGICCAKEKHLYTKAYKRYFRVIVSLRHKVKLLYLLAVLVIIAIVVGLVLYALRQNINLFYTPQQLTVMNLSEGLRIRVGGFVKKDSVKYAEDLTVNFVVTDFTADLAVQYTGVLPDLFREQQGVVVLGRFKADQTFYADQVLAKHDENYRPPGVQ